MINWNLVHSFPRCCGEISHPALISGTAPLTFSSTGGVLKNYRIYGNTDVVNGGLYGVGDLITDVNDPHNSSYRIPVSVNGSDTELFLSEPLHRTETNQDYVDYRTQSVVHNTASIHLSTEWDWKLQTVNNYNIANFRVKNIFTAFPSTSRMEAVSNTLLLKRAGIASTKSEGFLISGDGSLNIRLLTSTASTVDEFLAWLSQHPTEIVYYIENVTTRVTSPMVLPPLTAANGSTIIRINTQITPEISVQLP